MGRFKVPFGEISLILQDILKFTEKRWLEKNIGPKYWFNLIDAGKTTVCILFYQRPIAWERWMTGRRDWCNRAGRGLRSPLL
jgi:hypothetical protein